MGLFKSLKSVGKSIGKGLTSIRKSITDEPLKNVATLGLYSGYRGAGTLLEEGFGDMIRDDEVATQEETPAILGASGLEEEKRKEKEKQLSAAKEKRRAAPGRSQTILTRRNPKESILGS